MRMTVTLSQPSCSSVGGRDSCLNHSNVVWLNVGMSQPGGGATPPKVACLEGLLSKIKNGTSLGISN